MRMRQSLAQLEREFEQEAVLERDRREQLRRTAVRTDPRPPPRTRSRSNQKLRFLMLLGSIALTVVVVTWAMFQTLAWLMGRQLGGAAQLDALVRLGAQVLEGLLDLAAASGRLLLLDLEVDLFAEHRDVPRRLDPDADLLAHDREHRDFDVVTDHDALVRFSSEYEQVLRRLRAEP